MSPNITWGEGGLTKMSRGNFLLVIVLVQVDVREVGGEEMTSDGWGVGSKKCHVLFE